MGKGPDNKGFRVGNPGEFRVQGENWGLTEIYPGGRFSFLWARRPGETARVVQKNFRVTPRDQGVCCLRNIGYFLTARVFQRPKKGVLQLTNQDLLQNSLNFKLYRFGHLERPGSFGERKKTPGRKIGLGVRNKEVFLGKKIGGVVGGITKFREQGEIFFGGESWRSKRGKRG